MVNASERGVVVGLSGGLGNQMFQYAAGRALSMRLEVPLRLDTSWYIGKKDRIYALEPFLVSCTTCVRGLWMPEVLKSLESRLSRRFGAARMGVPLFRESGLEFAPAVLTLSHPVYLEGYWQSERYFSDIRNSLLQDFSVRQSTPQKCRNILDNIRDVDAVCVHVRRGDFASNPQTPTGTCAMEYFLQGLERVVDSVPHPHCFVFSDDPKWVKAEFSLPCAMTIVDVNSSMEAHLDLQLMTACKHFLIANSTMSWWAAWLGCAKNKVIVAPAKWFKNPLSEPKDFIPKSWHRI